MQGLAWASNGCKRYRFNLGNFPDNFKSINPLFFKLFTLVLFCRTPNAHATEPQNGLIKYARLWETA
jgi:hypothetical protein